MLLLVTIRASYRSFPSICVYFVTLRLRCEPRCESRACDPFHMFCFNNTLRLRCEPRCEPPLFNANRRYAAARLPSAHRTARSLPSKPPRESILDPLHMFRLPCDCDANRDAAAMRIAVIRCEPPFRASYRSFPSFETASRIDKSHRALLAYPLRNRRSNAAVMLLTCKFCVSYRSSPFSKPLANHKSHRTLPLLAYPCDFDEHRRYAA